MYIISPLFFLALMNCYSFSQLTSYPSAQTELSTCGCCIFLDLYLQPEEKRAHWCWVPWFGPSACPTRWGTSTASSRYRINLPIAADLWCQNVIKCLLRGKMNKSYNLYVDMPVFCLEAWCVSFDLKTLFPEILAIFATLVVRHELLQLLNWNAKHPWVFQVAIFLIVTWKNLTGMATPSATPSWSEFLVYPMSNLLLAPWAWLVGPNSSHRATALSQALSHWWYANLVW